MTAIVVGFFAGTLSALSPCVLPMIPIVVASAFQRHVHGPLAVAGGFVLASTATGLAFASLGFHVDRRGQDHRSMDGRPHAALAARSHDAPLSLGR
jgi:thiol:disulfide interchange protein